MSMQTNWVIPEWTVADRLVKARTWAGLDQVQIAERLGYSRQAVSKWEHGGPMKRGQLMAWAMTCGVPVAWIEHGEPGDQPPDGGPEGIASTRWYETPRLVRPYRFDAIAVAA